MNDSISDEAPPALRYNHCRVQPDNLLVCLYCGDAYQMTPSPVYIASAILRAWSKFHRECKPTPERIAKIKTDWEAQFKSHEAWIHGTDRGRSSETLWNHFTGRHEPNPDVPHDAADFGRCHRLLRAFPEWRSRLHEVGHRYPAWKRLAGRWHELELLYESEVPDFMEWNHARPAPQTNARMKELGL